FSRAPSGGGGGGGPPPVLSSCGDERLLQTPQGGRGSRLDPHGDELPRGGGAEEVDRRVAPRAAAQEGLVRARGTLDQHLLDLADARGVALAGEALREL